MAFCMYCGKQLEDGEICSCQSVGNSMETPTEIPAEIPTENPIETAGVQLEKQQPFGQANMQQGTQQSFNPQGVQFAGQQINQQQYQEKFNQAKEVSGAYLQQLWGALFGMLKKPVEEGKRFAALGDKKLAIGFFAIQAILSGIFSMVIFGKVNAVEKAASSFMGKVDSKYLFSLPKALLLTIIGSMILSFVVAGLLYVGVKILKGDTTFWKMACVAAVGSVGISIFLLLSIIVTFLNVTWGISIFALSSLVGLIFMIPVIQSAAALSENAQVYMISAVAILSIVAYFILFKIGMPMYVPAGLKDSYKSVIKSLGNLGSFSGIY